MRKQKINSVVSWKTVGMLLAILCVSISSTAYSQSFESKGAYEAVGGFVRKGNVVGLAAKGVGNDTIIIQDPISGGVIPKTRPNLPAPTSVNGKKIYMYSVVVLSEEAKSAIQRMEAAILQSIVDTIKAMQASIDASKTRTLKIGLSDIVIDEKGKVVYYKLTSVQARQIDGTLRTWNLTGFSEKLTSYFSNAPSLIPAMLNGKSVPHIANIAIDHYEFEIEKPFVTYKRTPSRYLGYELLYGMTK